MRFKGAWGVFSGSRIFSEPPLSSPVISQKGELHFYLIKLELTAKCKPIWGVVKSVVESALDLVHVET